jgi:hypothetical protein
MLRSGCCRRARSNGWAALTPPTPLEVPLYMSQLTRPTLMRYPMLLADPAPSVWQRGSNPPQSGVVYRAAW